jgi:apolipoprotein N-acyltransferase
MEFVKKIALLALSIALLTISWPPYLGGPSIYIAFIPLFFYERLINPKSRLKKYLLTFSGFFLVLFSYGFLVSYKAWGEYNSNVYMAILVSFLPLSLIVSLFSLFTKNTHRYLFLIFSWSTMEILQMNWELNSPLLMLGNSLCMFPGMIQHYAVWGVLGGTQHILSLNVVIFLILLKARSKSPFKREISLFALLFLPILGSIISYSFPIEQDKTITTGITIGNFEHFTKENSENTSLLVNQYTNILKGKNLSDVDIMLFSESTIVNGGWIENLNIDSIPNPIDSLCPGKEILFGAHLFSIHDDTPDELPYNVRHDANSKVNYETHNCVVFRNKFGTYSLRSKEKYVPFHEVVPYPGFLMFTQNWLSKTTVPTYLSPYKQSIEEPFTTATGNAIYGLMCFESFFSNMIIKQPKADFIVVLANESWNNQQVGKEQYFDYMTAKAIESGKAIVKVANCGYSGYIDSKGRIIEKIGFNTPVFKKLKIECNGSSSIYSSIATGLNAITIATTLILLMYKLIRKS